MKLHPLVRLSVATLLMVLLSAWLFSVPATAQDFQITTLTASNAVVVEVNGVVGDDRGGIAVSTSQAFLSGDGDTARFNRDTLGSSVGLGVVRDSLCANLRDGTVYLLGNGSTPIGYGGGTVTTLIQLDGTTGAVTTNVLTLSTSISFSGSSSSMGIFSGWDRIVLHNSTRVYRISLPSGTVTDLGAMGVPQRTSSESWAYWGVAENVGSDTYIVCVRNSTTIERTKVPSGPTTTVASFNNLSDMASFTVAPALGRWYFHHESGSQFGSFSESLGYATATFVTPASAPEIVVQPVAQSVIETEPVSLSVSANGTAPLAYQWRKDGSAISGATNNLYSIASVALADAGNFSVVVTNSAGSVTSSVVALTVSSLDAYQFKILSLKTNNFVVTDPLNYVGDDRGGLIATDQKVFLRGDDSVGSVNFDLSGGTRVGTNTGGGGFSAYTYDSLVSDLRSQKAYVLANGSTVLGVDGGTVTTLMEIHGTNGVPTGTNIALSSSIVLPSSGLYSARVGIFSGWGRILLHNDTNAYVINTTDGSVTNLGAMARPTRQASESWAYWGVAEYWGGSHYMVYARDAQTIVRTKIPDGTTTVVSAFNNLYDMASFTVVPHLSRWYFHDETINQFTNYGNYGAEILGYADSTLLFQPATIGSQPQNLTVTVGSNATLSVTATPVSPAFTLTYQWKKDGVPISGATNATLVFSSAQLGDSGTYSVSVGGGGSPVESTSATLTVLPNAAPVFIVPGTVTINEDAGAQTNYVTAIGPGAAHETNQTLTVTASSSATNLTGPLTVSYASGTASIGFTPVADAFGSATITVIVTDSGGTASGGVDRTTNSYVVNVTSVNDPPSATLLTNNVAVLEDTGAYSAAILSSISAGPTNEGQTVSISTTNNNAALFASAPSISTVGVLTFTPATNANGSATVTYVLSDSLANVTNTFTLTVTAVNDAPVANAQSVTNLEDLPVALTLTGSDVEGSSLTYTVLVGPTNGVLTGTAPNLTYTPDTNFFGGDSFTFKVSDGTVDSAAATVSLTVTAVNAAPSITFATNNLVVLEDSGAGSFTNFATYQTGPANEASQAITNVVTSNDNASLFDVAPSVDTNGLLTFTPAVNANGSATVTVIAQDDGGTIGGGVNLTTNTFTLTVLAVNDAPSFSLTGTNYSILEDAGAQTIPNAVTNIVAGPADEAGQTVSFEVSNTASNLFSAQPVISGAGTLTFTPAANANGSATVSVVARDDGGTANGGTDSSVAQVLTIVITAVNDAPVITLLTNNLLVLEDAGALAVTNFVTFASLADEAGQSITNLGVSNDNNGLFSAPPTVDTNGTLTFTPAANAYGSVLVTVIAQDDGGTANGGVDRATNTFTLTILPVNDAPIITVATNLVVVTANSGTFTGSGFASFSPGPANEASQSLTNLAVGNNNGALFSAAPVIGTNGTLTFTPALNVSGSAIVTVVVQDDGGTANGGVDLATNTFTITVNSIPYPPTVALTNPAPNAVFTAPAAITLMAEAADSDGSVARVEFLSGTNLLAAVTNAPYQFAFTNVGPGAYVFSAVATDDQSLSATSAPVSVVVNYPVSVITNLALNQAATQSSSPYGAPASRANDGNTNGAFGGSSVTHTGFDSQAWWEVDLGGVYGIADIDVFNRTDCCGERLSNFYVLVSDAPFASTDLATTTNQAGVSAWFLTGTADASESFSINRTGRYVRIQLAGNGYVSLAEVLVWGSTSTQAWVHVIAPLNGAVIEGTNPIPIHAEAFFSSSTVARVDFYSDSVLIGSVSNAPFTLQWSNLVAGSHALVARAVDTNGVSIASQTVSVTVELPNQPPYVYAGTDQVAFFPVTTNANAIIRPPGKIFISNDEWVLSNPGYTNCPVGADLFARKLAAWFTGEQPGNFLAYSANFGLSGTSLAATMASAGHAWTVSRSVSFTLTNLLQYHAVFLAGDAADTQVLIDYVNAGGNVFIAAGTSGSDGIIWNEFLNYFGLNYSATLNNLVSVVPLSSTHPALADVPSLFVNNGNLLSELNPANPNTDTVYHTNNLPLFASYQNTFSPIILGGQVTDDLKPNGSVVTQWWSKASGPPSGDAFFSNTNALTNRVVFSAPGTYTLRLTATDGVLTNSDEVQITVNPNQAPFVEAGQPIVVHLPDAASLNGSVFDDNQPDSAPLTWLWTVVDGPGSVTFGDAAVTNTTVTFTSAGLYTLRLTANDTQLKTTDDVAVIVLLPQNYPPTAIPGPNLTVVQPNSVTLAGQGQDDLFPAGSTLTGVWTKLDGPGNVLFPNGTNSAPGFTNTATFTLPGDYVMRLTVSDGELSGSSNLTVKVYAQGTTNQAPTAYAGTDQSTRLPDTTVFLDGHAGDDPFPTGSTLSHAWSLFSGPPGAGVSFSNASALVTTATFTQSGLYVLRLTVSDSELSASDDVAIRVYDPITGPPPTVLITSPVDGTNITAPTAVRGNISVAEWLLEYALGGEAEPDRTWTTLGTGTGPVANGVLGTLDSTLLLNGVYSVRLTATDSSGQITVDEITVLVDRNLKIGQFAFSFNDLTVPVAGIPITITRSYDSRDKRVGDFGVGWNLELQNIRLQKSRHLGRAWTQTSTGGDFPVYAFQQNKPRVISITFPNGKVHKFALALDPPASLIFPIDYPTARFLPYSDTKGTLTPVFLHHASGERIVDESLIFPTPIPGTSDLISFELLTDPPPGPADNILFNPDLFEFKTLEGYTYLLSATNGLRQLTDPKGNTLVVTTNGITWTNAASGTNTLSVLFQRDGQGRITNITDTAGNAMRYAYDTNGNLAQFIDRGGKTNSFTYDGRHNLLAATDAQNITPLDNQYDAAGRLVAHNDVFNNEIRYEHDVPNRTTSVIDRNNNRTTQVFDADGNLIYSTNALDGVTAFTYDADGRRLTMTNPLNETTTYVYASTNGALVAVINALGQTNRFDYNSNGQVVQGTERDNVTVVRMEYDEKNNLTNAVDALGNATFYAYNALGKPVYSRDALTNETGAAYDQFGNLIRSTNALGDIAEFAYDTKNRLIQQVLTRTTNGAPQRLTNSWEYDNLDRVIASKAPDNSRIETDYDANGRISARRDELNRQTTHQYDQLGRLVRVNYPDTTFEGYAYDAENRRIATINKLGQVTWFTYDKLGRMTSAIFPDGTTTTNYFNAGGRMVASTDARTNTTWFGYDAIGRVTSTTNALLEVTTYTYDARGNQVFSTDALNRTTTNVFDVANRLVQTLWPNGTFRQYTYDALGRRITDTDQSGNTTTNRFDALGRLVAVTNALSQVTRYEYNEVGEQTAQIDASGRTTRYEYDARSRRTSRILPLGQADLAVYNAVGNMTSHRDFNGNVTTFQYDDLNRLLVKTPDALLNEPAVSFAYNNLGQRTSMTDASGTTTYGYDTRNRLTTKATPQGTLTYTYDNNGNVASIASSNTDGYGVTYAYDQLNRLSALNDTHLGAFNYGYDTVGNLTGYSYPNGVTTYLYHDSVNRLTNLVSSTTLGALQGYTYTLAPTGHRLVAQELSGRAVNYAYDALLRLTTETTTSGVSGQSGTVGYNYDPVGNRLARSSNLPGILASAYTYNDNDRLTTGDLYDANGNTTTAALRANTTGTPVAVNDRYDFEDKLVNRNNGQVVIVYDGDGNRVRKTVGGVTTHYLVDTLNPTGHPQVVEELTSSSGAAQMSCVYTWGHALLAQDRPAGTNWTATYYGHDGQGSTRYLTDQTGQVSDTFDYDAFGNLLRRTGTTTNLYLYQGEQFDPDLGLYYLRARYADTDRGRFWSMDSFEGFGTDPASLHKYTLNHNDPVNRRDPSGHMSMSEGQMVNAMAPMTRGAMQAMQQNFRQCQLMTAGMAGIQGGAVGAGIGGGITAIVQIFTGEFSPSGIAQAAGEGYLGGFMDGFMLGLSPGAFMAYSGFMTFQNGLDFWKVLNDPEAPMWQKYAHALTFVTGVLPVISPRLAREMHDKLQHFCFPAGTEVAMEKGPKPIEEIAEGDLVWAQSDQTGAVSLKRVRQVFVNVATALVMLHMGTNTVEATPEHPFWVVGKGWKAAGQVAVGEELWTRDGRTVAVSKVEHRKGQFTVFNFEVENAHTYFAGGQQVLVHNTCNWRLYEDKIRSLYRKTPLGSRQFRDSNNVLRTADSVTVINGRTIAVESKFTKDWSGSPYNPNSSIGGAPFAQQARQEMIDQARRYAVEFGEAVYHTNSPELIAHYQQIFAQSGIQNVRFVLTSAP